MRQNKRIAITGGIGSGKSVVLVACRELGHPVFSCDEIYADLLGKSDFLAELGAAFPQCVKDDVLDRRALSQIAFSGEDALRRLNAVTHPRIMERLLEEMDAFPLSFAEVPLLYEGGFEGLFDAVIAVYRGAEERIRAVKERNGLSVEEIRLRIERQFPQEELKTRADFLIENSGTADELTEKVKRIIDGLKDRF